MKTYIKIGITIGDPNGIGPEIILKTFSDLQNINDSIIVIYSPFEIIDYYLKFLDIKMDYNILKSAEEAKIGGVNLLPIDNGIFKVSMGVSNKASGAIAFQSLSAASKDLIQNKIDCIVTAPIDKNTIQNKDFNFNGHTEYFTNLSKESNSLMLMVKDKLKVGIVTNHVPVNEVSKFLTTDQIFEKIELMHQTLVRDFNVPNPKIALLGLNPHSGDNGLIGKEEIEIIIPTIKKALKNNFNVSGPFPADGFFASSSHKSFDGILGMYHDQGLIPFKILSQNEGVNFTAGLSFIRTSPDHGTAYDIVGKNKANFSSFKTAVKTAKEIYVNRKNIK
jgi:4-hydroxythreonine-4-phosphate dehydrogenase